MAGTGKRPWPSRPRELDEPDDPAGPGADLWTALGATAHGETASDQARAGRLVARPDRDPGPQHRLGVRRLIRGVLRLQLPGSRRRSR
jgi:hypothetical protein